MGWESAAGLKPVRMVWRGENVYEFREKIVDWSGGGCLAGGSSCSGGVLHRGIAGRPLGVAKKLRALARSFFRCENEGRQADACRPSGGEDGAIISIIY